MTDNRSGRERRSGFDRRTLSKQERECLRLCRLAGAYFHGIQPGYAHIPDQLLFGSAVISTTLCLPLNENLTPVAIMRRLRESADEKIVIRNQRRIFDMVFGANSAAKAAKAGQ